MEALAIDHLSFTYPQQTRTVLHDVSLTLTGGQFVTLCGPSGCGKTTLLRQLKTVLAPHGARTGSISLDGVPLERLDQRTQSARVGFVLQSPEDQLVTDKVWHELAFGLESLGYDGDTIRLRVAEMASFFGIQDWFHKSVAQLSGGQKQLLNLASVMTLQPDLLLLDEPTAQLDPIAAAEFLATVGRLNRELGVTVLLSEHRLEDALPLSDRVIAMDGGAVVADGAPQDVGAALKAMGHSLFHSMPTPMRVWARTGSNAPCPITVRDGRRWLEALTQVQTLQPLPPSPVFTSVGEPAITLENVCFRYERDESDVVSGLSLTVPAGCLYAMVGGNGAGKTTVLSLISGLRRPYRGGVKLMGRPIEAIPEEERYGGLLGVLPQNPQALFVCKTVAADLLEVLTEAGLSKDAQELRVDEIAALCQLEPLLERHPYDLSGGEQQRAALAKVLLKNPRVLLLDEPTKGMDALFKEQLAAILGRLTAGGATVLMVSHDIEFCAQYADLCALFFDGAVVTQGAPRSFFSGNSFYTTAANRMARSVLPKAVTAEDIVTACGGTPEPVPTQAALPPLPPPAAHPPVPTPVPGQPRPALPKRTLLAALLIFLLIPLTLWGGITFFGGRKYFFVSLLVVLEAMLPFVLVFEGRRPQARELVITACLCAIAVAGRMAFFFVPQFKPVAAVVIIAAAAFGSETGFLVGAVSMLVSNIFLGQGSFTPFQMFAMGLIGFLAGVIFHGQGQRQGRVALCLFGFLSAFLLYGFIMNTYSVFQLQANVTWEMLALSCAMGMPMDLVHGGATAFFLWIYGPALLKKLDRIRVKYGLIASPRTVDFH